MLRSGEAHAAVTCCPVYFVCDLLFYSDCWSQRGDDHTGVQMTSGVSEPVLRKRDVLSVDDDAQTNSSETLLEQPNVISDVIFCLSHHFGTLCRWSTSSSH